MIASPMMLPASDAVWEDASSSAGQAEPNEMCDMELLITSVRPRLEFTGAYPPFIMPMIKMCHPALDPHHMDGN